MCFHHRWMFGEALRALPILYLFFSCFSCSSSPQKSLLIRELIDPPSPVQEIFAREGKSDYFLLSDEGYSFRLIYLCDNKILNFLEEPDKNPVLVSAQRLLDTPVELRLPPDDRRKIWACMERKVWEEHSRIEELKTPTMNERKEIEKAIQLTRAEKERLIAEANEKRRAEANRMLRIEQEKRREEEERLRRLAEEQRKLAEEERKLKYYRAGEKEDVPAPPPPPLNVTESGIFLVMKDSKVYQEPRNSSKVLLRAGKYHLFDVINSRRDESGNHWNQVIVSEKVVAEKGRRYGWAPEEKTYWAKNKLLVWIYPGDVLISNNNIKPLRLRFEDVQFTGKTSPNPQKQTFYEVSYLVNTSFQERILGWVHEKDGIRRNAKSIEEMRTLLNDLSKTLWPIRIQEDILQGYIRQGFSKEQVVLSWGRPDHVNTTRTLVGVHEQWVYGEAPFPKSYVYFENGLVNSWEFFENGK
jgi:hypothetical protein